MRSRALDRKRMLESKRHAAAVRHEAAITADYDAQSAVERELVLRLASILWRLRRATSMENGLFEIQAQQLHDYRQNRLLSNSREVIHAMFRRAESASGDAASSLAVSNIETLSDSGMKADATAVEFARCFLRLANLPNFALDRLSRYESTLWRHTPSSADCRRGTCESGLQLHCVAGMVITGAFNGAQAVEDQPRTSIASFDQENSGKRAFVMP